MRDRRHVRGLAPRVAHGLLSWALVGLLSTLVAAQHGPGDAELPPDADAKWREDPYTRHDPEAMETAGYVSLGRMDWGDDHDTRGIEQVLGAVQVLWVETAHFRIGSSLPELKITKEEKVKLQEELKRLKKRVPRVKDRTRVLDRWLRLHLYAQRLEELYAEFSELLGVTDTDFPADAATAAARDPAQPFMGNGPYLGRPDKFAVLLLEKKSSLGRYSKRYGQGQPTDGSSPLSLGFHGRGSLGFVTTAEFFRGRFEADAALHGHLFWNVTNMLLNGFKDYYHTTPRWLAEGLGHCFAREVAEDFPTFSQINEPMSIVLEEDDWGAKVRSRVRVDFYPPAKELMRWKRGVPLEFANHLMMWSRVDYLRQAEPEGFRRFVHALKAPIPVEPGRSPTLEEIFERQEIALKEALGYDAAGFDKAWAKWVLKNYNKR